MALAAASLGLLLPSQAVAMGASAARSPAPPGGVYGGRSTQEHPMSLRLTRNGKRLRDVFFHVDTGSCSSSSAEYTLALHLHSGPTVALQKDGSFADTRHVNATTQTGNKTNFEVALRGRVNRRSASGTIRVSGPVSDPNGNVIHHCDSGTVRWALSRAGRYGGATADEGALSIRIDRHRTRLRSFFIDFRIACGSRTFQYSLEHEGIAVRPDGRFSKSGLSGLPLLGPQGSHVSGQYRLRGKLGARSASGTYRAKGTARLTDGTTITCDSGVVHWTARRG
jgi:hypothetical protein